MANTEEKKLILLVEDEPSNIKVAHEILKDLYRTRVAINGTLALEAAKATPPPDLILLDIVMPEMDGYEVCTKLKADPLTRDIPIIFLTGMTDTVNETRGFGTGAVDYIHKPLSPPLLLARVRVHLNLREAYNQLQETVFNTLAPPAAPPAFRLETAAPLVSRLKCLLEAKDGDAVDLIQQVTDALAGGVDEKLLDSLGDSVRKFNFRTALAQLGEIARECGAAV